MKVEFIWGSKPVAADIVAKVSSQVRKELRPEYAGGGAIQCLVCEIDCLDIFTYRVIDRIQWILQYDYEVQPQIKIGEVDILEFAASQAMWAQELFEAIEWATGALLATRGKLVKGGEIARIRTSLERTKNLPPPNPKAED